MRGARFKSWSGLAVVTLLGACSNVIGVSSYEIDPSLDDGNGGANATAGKASDAGGKSTDGGEPNESPGGDDAGGRNVAGSAAGGEAGSAGEPSAGECQTAVDCDDTIDCTTDTCSHGACLHTPKDTLCDGSRCETCEAGIGCVAGPKTNLQLLADPGFDSLPASGDWNASGSDVPNVVTDAAAQTPTNVAQFGPGPSVGTDVDDQQYSDLFQYLTIPDGTVAITLTGYYKLTTGSNSPQDDQLMAAFYPLECADPEADPSCSVTKPVTKFHTFGATAGATTTWKTFSYGAPKGDVAKMAGGKYTFDLVAYVWDTVFQVDSLQVNATVCQ